VIEDACQAHGAEYFSGKEGVWKKPAPWAVLRVQFLSGQEFGACGEAERSLRTTKRCKRMKMIRDHGQAKKYYHDIEGYNGRLDSIQAAGSR